MFFDAHRRRRSRASSPRSSTPPTASAHVLPLPRSDATRPTRARTPTEYKDVIASVYERWTTPGRQGVAPGRRPGHGPHGHLRPRLHQLPPRREPQHLAARRTATSFLKDGDETSRRLVLDGVDWSRTRAFTLGLTGVFINRKGREALGHRRGGRGVPQARAASSPRSSGSWSIRRRARAACGASPSRSRSTRAPTASTLPSCWSATKAATATPGTARPARSTEHVFTDNTKQLVGRPLRRSAPRAGRVLLQPQHRDREPAPGGHRPPASCDLFGQEIPGYMQGEMIFPEDAKSGSVEGMLDPTSLPQSGAAPGALIFPERLEPSRRASGESSSGIRARLARTLARTPGRLRRRSKRALPPRRARPSRRASSSSASTAWIPRSSSA